MFAFSEEHLGTSMILGVGVKHQWKRGGLFFFVERYYLFSRRKCQTFKGIFPLMEFFPRIIHISLHVFAFV